jgi:hypothetical protein
MMENAEPAVIASNTEELLDFLNGLCICLVDRGVLDTDSLRHELERICIFRRDRRHPADSPILRRTIEKLPKLKQFVEQRKTFRRSAEQQRTVGSTPGRAVHS